MSSSTGLVAIASRVDELLLDPANMAWERQLAEECLANPELGHVNALFPDHPDEPFLDHDPNVSQTPGQRALIFAALHDVYCTGVEKVIAVPRDLTRAAVLADDQLIPAWSRAFRWTVILDAARGLGDWAVPWFELQMRRFERECSCEVSGQLEANLPATGPEHRKTPEGFDPGIHALVLLAEAQRRGKKPSIERIADELRINRTALYEDARFARFREIANQVFGLFKKQAKKADWRGARGSKSEEGTMEAEDASDSGT
jgi:hypothetical protein